MEVRNVYYEIIIGGFGIEYNAKLVAGEAVNHGIETDILENRGYFYVCAGRFSDKNRASEMLKAVQNAGYVFSYMKITD